MYKCPSTTQQLTLEYMYPSHLHVLRNFVHVYDSRLYAVSVLSTQLELASQLLSATFVVHRLCYRSASRCSPFPSRVFSFVQVDVHAFSRTSARCFALHIVSNLRCHTIFPAIPASHTTSYYTYTYMDN